MAYTDKEVAKSYVEDMTKYVSVKKGNGVWISIGKIRGRITDKTEQLVKKGE